MCRLVNRFWENNFLCFAQSFQLKKAGFWLFCTNPLAPTMGERLKKIRCPPLEDTIDSVGGCSAGFPNAAAVLGFPTSLLAGGGEVLGGYFAGFLGLGIFDFVEVHNFHFLSFLYLNYSIDCFICQALFFIFRG